jgi:hypothetical protein
VFTPAIDLLPSSGPVIAYLPNGVEIGRSRRAKTGGYTADGQSGAKTIPMNERTATGDQCVGGRDRETALADDIAPRS